MTNQKNGLTDKPSRENVSIVYNAMVQNAVSNPTCMVSFLTATLHVDEGTPQLTI